MIKKSLESQVRCEIDNETGLPNSSIIKKQFYETQEFSLCSYNDFENCKYSFTLGGKNFCKYSFLKYKEGLSNEHLNCK